MLDTIERPSTDKITEPAKRWRNLFRAKVDCIGDDGTILSAGQRAHTVQMWPSREIAEQKASEMMARETNPLCLDYLGAFPVEE